MLYYFFLYHILYLINQTRSYAICYTKKQQNYNFRFINCGEKGFLNIKNNTCRPNTTFISLSMKFSTTNLILCRYDLFITVQTCTMPILLAITAVMCHILHHTFR